MPVDSDWFSKCCEHMLMAHEYCNNIGASKSRHWYHPPSYIAILKTNKIRSVGPKSVILSSSECSLLSFCFEGMI